MIKEINIIGLFERYNYHIPLHAKKNDGITYLTGCNGLGKSTILRMLSALFKQDGKKLLEYPFHTFEVVFDNCTLKLCREYNPLLKSVGDEDINSRHPKDYVLSITYSEDGKVFEETEKGRFGNVFDLVSGSVSMVLLEHGCCYIEDRRLEGTYNETEGGNESLKRLDDCNRSCQENLRYLKKFVDKNLSPFFVPTRELVMNSSEDDFIRFFEIYDNLIDWGLLLNVEKSEYIRKDTNGGIRVLEAMSGLCAALYKDKRAYDIYIGFLRLKKIIDEYDYDNKTLEIGLEYGMRFVTRTTERKLLSLGQLSSGEQHILLQMYELLFNAPDGSLVLVDEPETSQHLAWQMLYYETMRRISIQKKLQFLIATHLPLMFNNDFSLSVDLYKLAHPEEF